MIMNNLRTYGNPPFRIAVIHGGPGAPGEMAPVARELSKTYGVLEPLQTKSTVKEQTQELKHSLHENASLPVTLIGHSWGAILSFIFTAQNSSFVEKLVLVGSGVFEDRYAVDITSTRLNRLSKEDRARTDTLSKILNDQNGKDKSKTFARLGELIFKADSYYPLLYKTEVIECQYDVYKSVWEGAKDLRSSGELVALGKNIQCPVVAIHGDYDPHPAEGIEVPLSSALKDFRLILLKNCGHYPWLERNARERFFQILNEELDCK